MFSNRKDSWVNGTGMLSSRSPEELERASVAGKPLVPQLPSRGALPFQSRFFETTGFAMLTTLIQRYRVEPHPKFAGESFEQLKERYSQIKQRVTLA